MDGVQERAVCSFSHEKQAVIKNFPLIFFKLLGECCFNFSLPQCFIVPLWFFFSIVARLVRTESVPCDINNPLRYTDLHISQTLPKTNKINKVSNKNKPCITICV